MAQAVWMDVEALEPCRRGRLLDEEPNGDAGHRLAPFADEEFFELGLRLHFGSPLEPGPQRRRVLALRQVYSPEFCLLSAVRTHRD